MEMSEKITNENKIFAARLKECMKEKGIIQQQLADELHTSRQAVSLYLTGQTIPPLDKLLLIVKFLNVSADYLLGLSDVKSTDIKVKEICELTGLNEVSIVTLAINKQKLFNGSLEDGKDAAHLIYEIINYFFSSPDFYKVLSEIAAAVYSLEKSIKTTNAIKIYIGKNSGEKVFKDVFSYPDLYEFYIYKATELFKEAILNYIGKDKLQNYKNDWKNLHQTLNMKEEADNGNNNGA